MAACKITVTGTSGAIRINYTVSGTPYTIETSIGEFYIEDTATDVTYTTLSGDLIATDDSCLGTPISELAANYYEISWGPVTPVDYIANAIFLGYGVDGEVTITDTPFPNTKSLLVEAINTAGDNRVKVVGYKIVGGYSGYPNYTASYILKVLGTERPDLRVRNSDNTSYIFIHGESTSSTLPSGYTAVEPCYSTIITSTTTIFAP